MERLTERTSDGIVVKEDYGEKVLRTIYECYGAEPAPHYVNCAEGYCAMEKLAEYEDLEEKGLLMKLPVAKGDTIYPLLYANGKPKYVDESEVVEISDSRIWIESTYFDYADIGKTVFLTREQAEQALKMQIGV